MTRFRHSLVLALLAASAGTAFAHAHLQASEPRADSTGAAPTALRLHYNEAVEPAMSSVKLVGPGDAPVAVGKPVAAEGDDHTLVAPVPALAAGAYRLQWSTMGHDGHHVKGELRFSVK